MTAERFVSREPHVFITPELEIHGMECWVPCDPSYKERLGETAYWLMMFFHEPMFIEDADGWLLHQPPCLMIWPPGGSYRFGGTRPGWRHSWVQAEGPFFRREMEACGIPVGRVIPLPDLFSTEKHLLDLRQELEEQASPDPLIVRNLTHNLLLEIGRICRSEPRDLPVPVSFVSARSYIRLNYAEQLRMADVAHRANVSLPYFCSQFKRYFGISPLQYLTHVRMQHAEALLRNPALNVSQVAEAVGYQRASHFCRIFKRNYGFPPGDLHRWAADIVPERLKQSPRKKKTV